MTLLTKQYLLGHNSCEATEEMASAIDNQNLKTQKRTQISKILSCI